MAKVLGKGEYGDVTAEDQVRGAQDLRAKKGYAPPVIGNVGEIRNANQPVASAPVVKPDYIPGASEQKVIDANTRAKAAPYTSDPAVLSARRSDQFEKAYLERTAPRSNVTTPGTEVELRDALGRPRGFGTESAPYVTKPAPAVVNAGDMPAGWPEKGVAPVSAPVVAPITTAAVPVKAVPASGKGSIMNQTFNALAGQKLDVAGPGRVGNPEHQKIFDQKYAEIAAAQGQPVRSPVSTKRTFQSNVVPQKPTVVPIETPVVAPSLNSVPTPAVPEVAPAVPKGQVIVNAASQISNLVKKNPTPENIQKAQELAASLKPEEQAAIKKLYPSLLTPEEKKAVESPAKVAPPLPTSEQKKLAQDYYNKQKLAEYKNMPLLDRASFAFANQAGNIPDANDPNTIRTEQSKAYQERLAKKAAEVKAAEEKAAYDALVKEQNYKANILAQR